MAKTESRQQLGVRGEDLACAELERQGMQVLERNWRCRLGEIDIVAADVGGAVRFPRFPGGSRSWSDWAKGGADCDETEQVRAGV
jgi:Holliday junction resolvase-like predicted endonuclease